MPRSFAKRLSVRARRPPPTFESSAVTGVMRGRRPPPRTCPGPARRLAQPGLYPAALAWPMQCSSVLGGVATLTAIFLVGSMVIDGAAGSTRAAAIRRSEVDRCMYKTVRRVAVASGRASAIAPGVLAFKSSQF